MANINVHIKGTQLDLTPKINQHVHERIGQLEKYITLTEGNSALAEVELEYRETKQLTYRVEINFTNGGDFYNCESKHEDLFAGLDDARNELIRQLTSHTGKKHDIRVKKERSFKKVFRKMFGK